MDFNLDKPDMPPIRPSLLVSVKDVHEAKLVGTSSVDYLDVKDPSRGSLGKPEPEVLRNILELPLPNKRLSVALGEARHLDFSIKEYFKLCDPNQKLHYAKFGLAETARWNWRSKIGDLIAEFPIYITPVLRAYADFADAEAPKPLDLISLAAEQQINYVLFDTYNKVGKNTFDFIESSDFQSCYDIAKKFKIKLAIAGSIKIELLTQAMLFKPDVIAVRGAACDSQSRCNSITTTSLQRFIDAFQAACYSCDAS